MLQLYTSLTAPDRQVQLFYKEAKASVQRQKHFTYFCVFVKLDTYDRIFPFKATASAEWGVHITFEHSWMH